MGLFETIGLIHSKDHYPSEDEMKDYVPFMGNRALSQYQDLIFFAQAMNEKWGIPKEANFAFYYYGVDKKKRWASWAKKEESDAEKIKIIKERYNYSTIKCREIIPIIDSLELWDKMKQDLNKGGSSNDVTSEGKPSKSKRKSTTKKKSPK